MLFNSYSYFLFFIVVFCLYWAINPRRVRLQNALLSLSSYFFYSCWDYRFLALLLFSTILDFVAGSKINQSKSLSEKKIWLYSAVGVNLCLLFLFKYYNFFLGTLEPVFDLSPLIPKNITLSWSYLLVFLFTHFTDFPTFSIFITVK